MLLHERVRVPTALMSRAAGTRVLCLLYAQQSVYSMDATLWSSRHKQLRKWASFQLLLWTIIKSKYFSFLITPIMQLWMFYWEKSLVVAFTIYIMFLFYLFVGVGGIPFKAQGQISPPAVQSLCLWEAANQRKVSLCYSHTGKTVAGDCDTAQLVQPCAMNLWPLKMRTLATTFSQLPSS